MPFDIDSSTVVQEPDTTTAKEGAPPPPPIVKTPFDFDSSKPVDDTQARIALNPPKPLFQKITDFALNPVAEVSRAASEFGLEKGYADAKAIDFLPLHDDTNKSRDSGIISNLTGIPQADVEEHYDALKTLYHFTTGNLPAIGEDLGARVPGRTEEGILNAVMTPAIVAGIVANPPLAIASLIGFAALDHVVKKTFNIDEQLKKMPQDEASKMRLGLMFVEAVATGGVEHGIKEGVDITTNPFRGMEGKGYKGSIGDVAEKYIYQRFQDFGLPDVITLHPDAVDKINQMDAAKKMARKNDLRRQNIVNDLASKLMENEPMPDNVAPEIIRDAKQKVVDQIDLKEANGEKIMNREQQVRFDLKKQLASEPEPKTILGTMGVDQKTADAAVENKLAIKVKAEKLVIVAMDSKDDFDKVREVIAPQGTTPTGEMKPAETGTGKESGVAKGIEKEAIEQKLTDKGFDDLAEYTPAVKKEQAELISNLMKSDIERAKRIATGKEEAPAGLRTEALFTVMKDYAMEHRDGQLARDLASSKVASEISSAGSKLSLSGIVDPDSATGKIQEVVKEKEAIAEKKMKGKAPEEAKAEIKKELVKRIAKEKPNRYDLMRLLDEIVC